MAAGGWRDRIRTGLLVVVLLGVGFLLGSFWLEWRHTRLAAGGSPAELEGTPVAVPDGWDSRVRVEVLNGMGEPGAARRAAGMLRQMGFDVVYYGNADRFDHVRTRVLRRSPAGGGARRLADSLGVDSVIARPAPELYLDGTVILGEDWTRLKAVRDSIRRAARESFSLERLLEALRP